MFCVCALSVCVVCACVFFFFFCVFFFFSSRRRHTRLQGDWSSDVCSSDLDWRITWNRPEMSEVQRVSHYVLQCHPVCYITNPIIQKGSTDISASYNYLFVSILFQPTMQQDNYIYCSWLNKILALQHVMLHNQLFNMRSMFQHNLVNSAQDSGQ